MTLCEAIMLDRALAQLTEIAGRDHRAAAAQTRLQQALHSLAEPVKPRAAAALVQTTTTWRPPTNPRHARRPAAPDVGRTSQDSIEDTEEKWPTAADRYSE